jgi:hypothetical protein
MSFNTRRLNKMLDADHRLLLSIKTKGLLTHAAVWMAFKDIMINKTSQSQEVTHCMTPFIGHSPSDKAIKMEHR